MMEAIAQTGGSDSRRDFGDGGAGSHGAGRSRGAPAVSIRGVRKTYRSGWSAPRIRAVDGVSFDVRAGEVCGLLGPNGSGKTTVLRILLGLVEPDAGTAEVFGRRGSDPMARLRVGFLPESPVFHRFMSGREFVEYGGRLCGMSRRAARARAEALLEQVGLGAAADRRIAGYSKGMNQRLGIAQAMVHDPDLLVLDEPADGVDPAGVEAIGRLVASFRAEGKAVLLASHLLTHVASLCDRVGVFNEGRIVWSGPVGDLLRSRDVWSLEVEGYRPDRYAAVAAALAACGVRLKRGTPAGVSIEERFLELAARERAGRRGEG